MTNKKKNKRRRWLLYLLGALLLLVVLLLYLRNRAAPKGEEIEVAQPENRTIKETVSASGRVYPEIEVIISSDVSGEIVELFVEEGDSVIMGQLLLKIDPEAYISNVERAQANLDNSKAQLSTSRAQIQANIAQKEELQTQLIQAQRVHDRNEKLFNDGIISQAEYDESLSQVESLQASIRSAEASIKSSEESAKGAEFSVKSSGASLREMRTNLSRTNIIAPTSGIISSLSVERGERVVGTAQMTGTEIMRISDLNTMEVQVEVSENDIIKVSLDDETDIEVDAYIDRKFKGRVTEIANSATNLAGQTAQASLNTDQVTNFIVKIRLDPASYEDLITPANRFPFRPGMSASVDIITDVKENVLSVPIQAVTVRLPDGQEDADYDEVVFVMEADTARKVIVKTGIQDDEFIHIVQGLQGEESIVTGPYSALSKVLESGTALRIKEEKDKDEG